MIKQNLTKTRVNPPSLRVPARRRGWFTNGEYVENVNILKSAQKTRELNLWFLCIKT